jgi:hypothetical protein
MAAHLCSEGCEDRTRLTCGWCGKYVCESCWRTHYGYWGPGENCVTVEARTTGESLEERGIAKVVLQTAILRG